MAQRGRLGAGVNPSPLDQIGAGASVPVVIRRDTYDVTWTGSSSTQGNQDGLGHTVDYWTGQAIAGTKALNNLGQGGSTTSTVSPGVRFKLANETASQKLGTNIIQFDTNDWLTPGNPGEEFFHVANFVNDAVPSLDAACVAAKRFGVWVGTEDVFGFGKNGRNQRFQRLLWAYYPGQVVNMQEYWNRAAPDPAYTVPSGTYAGGTDANFLANGMIPASYQITDRSHPNSKGSKYFIDAWEKDLIEAAEGGCPFFALYPYLSALATRQTNGGDVVQLAYVGSLTGAVLSVRALDGSVHPDLGVSASGMLTRVSATIIKAQFTPFLLRVTKGGNTKDYYQRVKIPQIGTAPRQMTVDGHVWGTMETNDNAGTALAPSFPTATTRIWTGLGAGDFVEQSWALDFTPGNADGSQLALFYMVTGIQITRTTGNFMRVSNRDKSAVAHGQITTSGTGGGLCNLAHGRFLMFYSLKVDAGAAFQQLIIDDGTNTIRHTATPVAPAGVTINVNPLASAAGITRVLALSGDGGVTTGLAGPGVSSNCQGTVGFQWASTSAIDWSVNANRALFRSSLASLTDLGGTGTVTVQAGGAGYNVGASVTPYFYSLGDAALFGKNFGTGGDHEVWSRVDPTGALPLQGIAQTV